MYPRDLKQLVTNKLFKGKILFILGARQVGKTTLVNEISENFSEEETIKFNCDYLDDRDLLSHEQVRRLEKLLEHKRLIVIDEVQKVYNISEALKILVDKFKNKKQIIATGSSSINILDEVSEPLTGRKEVFKLYPLSLNEILQKNGLRALDQNLEEYMLYGLYPEVVTETNIEDKKSKLEELSSSYLYKDVLEFEDIKKSFVLDKLVKLLALQIGSELSFTNLSRTLGLDIKTVEKYIHILEKAFVIKLIAPYSTGGKREITKKHKIYFMDLGIRNALINNFNNLDLRTDKGQLWENFLIIERLKYLNNKNITGSYYFWRTYDGAELDWVESRDGRLWTYEFKYSSNSKARAKCLDYNGQFQLITRANYEEFLLDSE